MNVGSVEGIPIGSLDGSSVCAGGFDSGAISGLSSSIGDSVGKNVGTSVGSSLFVG